METLLSLELPGAAEETVPVEEKVVGKTFLQKTKAMIQTKRLWMERRWSERSWAGGEEDGSSWILVVDDL